MERNSLKNIRPKNLSLSVGSGKDHEVEALRLSVLEVLLKPLELTLGLPICRIDVSILGIDLHDSLCARALLDIGGGKMIQSYSNSV